MVSALSWLTRSARLCADRFVGSAHIRRQAFFMRLQYSRMYWGIWVVFPQPDGPLMQTIRFEAMASTNSLRFSQTGRLFRKRIVSSTRPEANVGGHGICGIMFERRPVVQFSSLFDSNGLWYPWPLWPLTDRSDVWLWVDSFCSFSDTGKRSKRLLIVFWVKSDKS